MSVEKLITDHIDIWSSALQTRSTAGRGSNGKIDLYGIKKLRELILELAVRGKLVRQDQNDEPASELLKRIAAEKAELVKQGKIKKQKPLPEISEDEKPFELPEGWEWVRLGELFNSIASGGTPSKTNPDFWNGDIPWASVKDLGKEKYIAKTQDYISHQGLDAGSKLADEGDILICTRMGLGKIGIASCPVAFNQDLKSVKLTSGVSLDFFFNTYSTIKIKGTGTTVEGIKQEQLLNYVIGLPSGNEQHQIIEKVDELMSICDQLEQQSLTSLDVHQQLVETLLATLTGSQNAEVFAENWARISQHFDTLFTTEASIDALKKTILQLAVMGKLVPQDPNDEPASELLKRIEQEKAQLVKEGKIKKQKPLPPVSDEEKPFELPKGWEWCRFGSVINIRAELVKPENYYDSYQVAPDIIEKGTGKVLSQRTVRESGVKGPNSRFYKNQIVYSKIRPSLSKAFIAEYDGLCSADMYPLDCFLDAGYLLKVILSEVFLMQVRVAENRIKMPKLNVESLSNIVIPIPPVTMQGVVYRKISQIDTFCDTLKSRLQSAQQTQLHLADALTDAALN
ncbi:restriction endonuclease subunit S [Serratia marcescens]|nr:restriction endonuclease subunit S [Serratia marcescens]MBH2889299.1 restriction endonuclease subunit S [Serratia marcescens]